MKKSLVLLGLILAIGSPAFSQIQTGKDIAVTNTESGKVRGTIRNGIYTYKGIPYATAKRFESAQKPPAWEGVRSSLTWGPVAPLMQPVTQVSDEIEFVFDHDWGYTNEDCLVLNVWTPGINDDKKRPVMLWIHGGGFTAGSSQELPSYHGENLAKKGDVVLVSINHRLNILGFLDLSAYGDKYLHSANNSIHDMKVALEWVKKNIENFGGDPDNVTIFGQSGGGAKVNTLMAMPSASGLFQKAINQSGSFRMEMLGKNTTREIASEVLHQLNLNPDDVDSLQNIPFELLAKAGTKALSVVAEKLKSKGQTLPPFGLNWGPSLDENLLPYQLFSGEAMQLSKDIPLLIGTVKNEFMPSLSASMIDASLTEVEEFIRKEQGETAEQYINAVKKAYPDDTKPSDLMDIDTRFRPGAIYQANKKSALTGGAAVYMYLFSWQSPVLDGKYKALHCMEIGFAFDNIDRSENMTGATKESHALAEKVSQAWINFAYHGNPNHGGLPEWEAYSEGNGTTMFFDNTCHIRYHHDKALLDLLDKNQSQ